MSIINSRGIFNLGTAYLRQVGNDWPTAQVISTSDITEGINLYFSNARVYSNVIALLPALAGSGIAIQANGQISANAAVVTFASISQFLTTSNVAEGSNLYYTNARVISAVLPYLTTSNVAEGSNLYYTNARVYSNVIALLPTLAGSGIQIQANGQINANASATSGFATSSNVANTVLSLSNFTTANLVEGSNLYYTNARVYSNVIGLLPSLAGSGIQIQANGQINASTATVSLAGLTTSNLAEGSNLYYTNARVSSNVIGLLPSLAGQNVSILANGQISANIVGITVAATETISILAATTTYTMSRSVANPESIFVINEGLIQIPTTDYTVSGTTLTTTTQYPVGSNLEIRYFGTTSTINSTTTVIGGVNPISFMLSGL